MNPLSPNRAIVSVSFFYKVSTVITYDKYVEPAWLLAAAASTYRKMSIGMRNRLRTPQLASWHEYQMAHDLQKGSLSNQSYRFWSRLVIVLLSCWTLSCLGFWRFHVARLRDSLCRGFQSAQASAISQASVCTGAASASLSSPSL